MKQVNSVQESLERSMKEEREKANKARQELLQQIRKKDKKLFLLSFCQQWADAYHDGHLTIMKFTSHTKAFFETPDLDSGDGRGEVWQAKAYKSLEEALLGALADDCNNWNKL